MRRFLRGCAWYLLFPFAWGGSALAANAVVSTCDQSHFTTAFDTVNAAPGGTLSFSCSGALTLTSSPSFYVDNGVAMVIDGGGNVTLDGGGTYALVQVYGSGHLTLKRLTLQHMGSVSMNTGHPIESFGTLTLDTITAKNNSANVIFNAGGSVQIADSSFSANSVTSGEAAAIYNQGGTVTIGGSTFSDNTTASGSGAAIYNQGTLLVSGTAFSGNSSGSLGGAVENDGGDAYFSDCTFTSNHAFDGGAIHNVNGAILHVSHSTLNGNTAGYGGAIENFSDDSSITLDYDTFTNNQADNMGGAIWNQTGLLSVNRSQFNGNSTAGPGGAIRCDNSPYFSVGYSTFASNTSNAGGTTYTNHGGAISSACYFVAVNDTFYNNTATNAEGGAIYQDSPTSSQFAGVFNSTFVANHAAEGAAVGNEGAYSIEFSASILSGNTHGHSCAGSFSSVGYSLADDSDCGGALSATGDVPNTTLTMGSLTNNGGPTQTILPATGNPAINHLPTNQCSYSTDQRGATRPAGPACDSGAVEVGGAFDEIFKDTFELP